MWLSQGGNRYLVDPAQTFRSRGETARDGEQSNVLDLLPTGAMLTGLPNVRASRSLGT